MEKRSDAALMMVGASEGFFAGEAEKRGDDDTIFEQVKSRQLADAEEQRSDAEEEQRKEWRDAIVEVGRAKKIEERAGGILSPDGDGEAEEPGRRASTSA